MIVAQEIIKATDLSDSEDYAGAVKVCDAIIAYNASYDRAYFERAMALLNLDLDDLALKDFERLEQINPTYPGLKDWQSRVLKGKGQYLEAGRCKLDELREFPNGRYNTGVSPQDWAACAQNLHRGGETDTAIALLKEYFETHSQRVGAYRVYETAPLRIFVRIMITMGNVEEARRKIKQALQSEHRVPADHELWIEVNILTGHTVEASKALDYYVNEIHQGFETDSARKLRAMLRKP